MVAKIYVLCEPDGEIRYIGKTSYPLAKRLAWHLREARRSASNHRLCWIRSVMSRGYLPGIVLIGEVAGDGNAEEIAWIKYGRQEGWRLVNGTDGGEGTVGKSADALRKISIANKGKTMSPEARKKISDANKGRVKSAEEIKKLKASLMGHIISAETRRKISESKKGKILSEEHKHNIGKSLLGKKRGPYKKRR